MIDNRHNRFLNFQYFVTSRRGGGRSIGHFAALASAAWLAGCSPQPASRPVEDSLTSGRIKVECASEAGSVILLTKTTFERLYPEVHMQVSYASSRSAVQALFAAQSDLAVITRELEPEEREAAVRGGLELEGFRFARDAVVPIVHPSNPVENIAMDELRGIYRGQITNWSALGGRRAPIVAVLQPLDSDVTAFFMREVLHGDAIGVSSASAAGDSEVVAYVRTHPDAIGFVTLAWAERGARALRVASMVGLPYWKSDLEAVYRGQYPLTRYFNLYVRTNGPRAAHGFITYVTSREGQQQVKDAGLVPTAVPVRFVRRSPMLSTH